MANCQDRHKAVSCRSMYDRKTENNPSSRDRGLGGKVRGGLDSLPAVTTTQQSNGIASGYRTQLQWTSSV